MHLGTDLSARQVVRAVGVSGGLALAFFFAGAVMASPMQGGSGPTTSTTSCTTTTTQQCSTTSTSTPTTSSTSTPTTKSTSTPTTSSNTASTPTTTSSATSTGGASQTGSENAYGGTTGSASNTGTGSCGCSNGNQTAKDNATSTTSQIIVQVAPTTAIASATNYGHGSATATAVASPTQTATVSGDTRANDPAMNTGNDHSTANSTVSNTTNQQINQYAPTTAVATATNYGNGTASASAVAAPTQSASISNKSSATDHASNVGLDGCGCQSATNSTSNTTTQKVTQEADATADAIATNGDASNCGCEWWGNGSGNATAVAVAAPKQTASESSTSGVTGSANNVGYGNGYQNANNTSKNTTNQIIDQYAPTTATAIATNVGGHHSTQNASAVADAQPTQVAIEASSAWVNGSANNIGTGYGYGYQSATNTSNNETDQYIGQAAPTTATAIATNDGHHGTESATAAAVASPSQKAGETSSVTVNGSASNYSIGRGDQVALNVSTNDTNQDIEQGTGSRDSSTQEPTTATAIATNDGHKANQSASALASANPSETAAIASTAKVTGEAINTNVNTSAYCGCESGHGAHQDATNYSTNNSNQVITQNAPTIATAIATNNGFSYSVGESLWNGDYSCGCSDHGNHNSWDSNQSATAIAAAAPVQEAAISANATVNGQAVNTNTGNGRVHQTATNYSTNNGEVYDQSINQDAGTDVTATAENTPGSHSVSQSAIATAAGAPMQAAAITSNASVNGAALNNASTSSDSSDCGCSDYYGHGYQHATNTSDNYVDQTVEQLAPTTVVATAKNDQFVAGYDGTQVATAIAAAKPTQGASLSDTDNVHGAAVNVGQGNSHQHATNTSDNYVNQDVDQSALTTSTADAENAAGFVGDDNTQVASAVSAAAPAQAATITNSASVTGSAANVNLGGHHGHQTANNYSYNTAYQTVDQLAPTTATADAINSLGFAYDDNSQSVSAVAAAAPKQSANTKGSENVSGSASNVGLGHGYQDAENLSSNFLNQDTEQDLNPVTATANAENTNLFGGDNDHQSTTASAGVAPSQTASQTEADNVSGSASNAAIAQGHFGSQYASNISGNSLFYSPVLVPTQYILQQAPTTADAEATNDLYTSDDENLPVTAVAASAPSQNGSQTAKNEALGTASNTGVAASGCGCGFGDQDAENTSYNTSAQSLTQQSENIANASAAASAYFADGDWSGDEGEFGCGCNALTPFFGAANTNNSHATSGAKQTNSSTVKSTNNGALPSFNGLGSSDLSIDLPNLGISFSLGMLNNLVIGTPSVQQLLNGSAQVSLLHGATGLNMHLSVTTPWVQYAEAVANVTPFQVLFGYTNTPSISWLGSIL